MGGKRISSRRVRKLPRPHPDPHVEWQLQMLDAIDAKFMALFSFQVHYLDLQDRDLETLDIVVGPRLDIDGEPLDFEPRFFIPASRERVESGIREWKKTGRRTWPRIGWSEDFCTRYLPTPDYPPDEQWLHAFPELNMACEVRLALDRLISGHREKTWTPFGGRLGKEMTARVGYQGFDGHVPHSDGTETFERSSSCIKNVVFAKKNDEDTTPFPHVVIELGQTQTPPEDRPTRFEVHHASMVLRFMLLNRHWTNHHTFPILMFSYHGHGGRILQIYQKKGKMVVRMSRILNLTRHRNMKMTDDARIALRWLLSTPAGETRFGDSPMNHLCSFDLGDGYQDFPRPAPSLSVEESECAESAALTS